MESKVVGVEEKNIQSLKPNSLTKPLLGCRELRIKLYGQFMEEGVTSIVSARDLKALNRKETSTKRLETVYKVCFVLAVVGFVLMVNVVARLLTGE